MNKNKILDQLKLIFNKLRPYKFELFALFVLIIYSYIILQVISLSQAKPTSTDISSQTSNSDLPKFNQALINKIYSLQNNSVNVKALFNQARQNPFNE